MSSEELLKTRKKVHSLPCSTENRPLSYNQFREIIFAVNIGRGFMALETELATYKSKLPELKGSEGKFVLIRGTTLIGTFTSYEDAIKEGYAQFKLEPFLVKQIQAIEQVQFVTRLVAPSCTPV